MTPSQVLTVPSAPSGVAIGDLNGDGRQDLAATLVFDNTIAVFLQDLTGAIPGSPTTTLNTGLCPETLITGDLNGDDRIDLAVLNAFGDSVTLYFQSPSGTLPLNPSASLNTQDHPQGLSLDDVNGDGQGDLVVANRNVGTLTVYLRE